MRFTVVTLFPDMFGSFLQATVVGRARAAGLIEVDFVDPRDFTTDKHRSVDDSPYGGGPGMVMKAPPLIQAIESIGPGQACHRVLLSPAGCPLQQARVRELAKLDHLVLVCGRYEGIDERVAAVIDERISVGDFVLSGGEPAAMAVVDAVCRYVPGVLGEAASVEDESFSDGLLEYPQYTRPAEVRGVAVPEVLQSGNHAAIAAWRRERSLEVTAARRPDLLLAQFAAVAARTFVALVHHPVYDRDQQVVTTSVTNLDIHDIARAAATYGLAGYYVITPITAQREMVAGIAGTWSQGCRFDERGLALARVRTAASLDDCLAEIARAHRGVRARVIATTARAWPGAVPVPALPPANTPMVLLFGTGHGLTDAVVTEADQVLMSIQGSAEFNHLSVRSAVAITLDRIFGKRTP
jgi:tRNA (guanine37-N1)-methyltransferase